MDTPTAAPRHASPLAPLTSYHLPKPLLAHHLESTAYLHARLSGAGQFAVRCPLTARQVTVPGQPVELSQPPRPEACRRKNLAHARPSWQLRSGSRHLVSVAHNDGPRTPACSAVFEAEAANDMTNRDDCALGICTPSPCHKVANPTLSPRMRLDKDRGLD